MLNLPSFENPLPTFPFLLPTLMAGQLAMEHINIGLARSARRALSTKGGSTPPVAGGRAAGGAALDPIGAACAPARPAPDALLWPERLGLRRLA